MRAVPSAEFELLLHCARVRLDEMHARAISDLLDRNLDWHSFVSIAQRHGVNPLVYRTLMRLNSAKVPSQTLERLRSLYETNRVRNLVLVSELLKAVRALASAGVTGVPHKGPALAAALYGDFALRLSVDVDIRVRPCDAVAAHRAIIDMGYSPDRAIPRSILKLYARYHYEFAFLNARERMLMIELHWRNAPTYYCLPEIPDRSWERLTQVSLAGASVPCYAPEDLLFDLCMHGCKHKWRSLKWIVDIAEFLRVHADLDWLAMLENAQAVSAERMLALGIFLAHDLLDAQVPPDLLAAVRSKRAIASLADEVCENLLCVDPERGDTLFVLPFVARVAENIDARLSCRALMLPYFVLDRMVRPGIAVLRRAANQRGVSG
ncbi:MAG TPA: nucleotidyltransferase family protein [Burkholderiales bacterium]|nr:nucleotidyltransferase family protein [Burkholderiales bacterium]